MSIVATVLAVVAPLLLLLVSWALCYWPLAGVVRMLKVRAKRASAWIDGTRVGSWAVGTSGTVGSYAPILLVVTLGALAAVGAGVLFHELAEHVTPTASAVTRIDESIHTWFAQERQPALTALFTTAANAGGVIGEGAIVTLAAATLFLRKERASGVFLVVTAGTGALLNLGLKSIYARARPDLTSAIAVAHWYAFPSGHAMDSFVTLAALAYIALRQPWPWAARSASLAIAMTMTALVGISRVYLGVHWASDIAGGWCAAAVWVAFAVVAFEMLLRLRQRRRGAVPTSAVAEVPDTPPVRAGAVR